MESNYSFVNGPGRCELCGGDDVPGGALSIVKMLFGYGSEHDAESIELAVCGECADKIYKMIVQQKGGGSD